MSAQLQPVAQVQPPPAEQSEYRGRFKKGYDPRRHRFTQEECSAGFWAAIESVAARYPDAVDSAGRHMVCKLLPALIARKPKRIN